MAAPFLTRKRVAIGKAEGTPGTGESIVKADFNTRIFEPRFTPNIEFENDLKYTTGDHTEDIDVSGARWGTLSFKTFVNTDGTANGKPNWVKFAESSGVKHHTFSTFGNSISPRAEADGKTMTIWIVDVERGASPEAIEYKFSGAMANAVLSAPGVGKPIEIRYEFKGKLLAPADNITPFTNPVELTAPDTTNPFVNLNTAVDIGGATMKVASWELDFGNNVEMEIDSADPTGICLFNLIERKPRLSINPLKLRLVTADILSKTFQNTKETITITNSAAIPLKLTIPQAQIIAPEDVTREGLEAWQLSYKCLRNGQVGSLILSGANNTVEDTWELLIGAKS